MEIKDRLIQQIADDRTTELTAEGMRGLVLKPALQRIQELEAIVAHIERNASLRFDLFFAAALQGLLARSTAADLMRGKTDLVGHAWQIALLANGWTGTVSKHS